MDGLSGEGHFAIVRREQAIEDLDQRRLAGAILAEQCMNLAGEKIEIDVIIRGEVTKPLHNVSQRHERRSGGTAERPRGGHGTSTVAPVVARDSRAACAFAASARG